MSNAFNDFLSSVAGGASGDGGPNMKNYQHATKLYVEGNYARAPKVNHLYFVGFNINNGVIRDPGWAGSGANEVGLLVRSATLPKFKITTELMNQYNRKTQVQTKLNYEPVSMEFHDDNSGITNGLWKNYYRYYYTDSIYGGKDDTVAPTPSQVSLGKKLFGGLLSPGRKRIKALESSTVPDAYTNNKYKLTTYPYGLDNLQSIPFFKSIDIFVLHQQKFTQMTLVNPKIISWDHDDVGQGDSTKTMRNKMSVIYENVLYNSGSIGKGSRSGVFAEAFYDSSPSPLSIAGKGSTSLFGSGGILGGIEDVFGENGALAQGNYLAAALQAATLIKNAGQITEQQLSAEGYSMLGAAVGVAVSSRNGEILNNLQNYFGNGGAGVYTNQFSKNNLEDIPAKPVEVQLIIDFDDNAQESARKQQAQQAADVKAREEALQEAQVQENAALVQTEVNRVGLAIESVNAQRAANDSSIQESAATIAEYTASLTPNTSIEDPIFLAQSNAYKTAISLGIGEEAALQAATQSLVRQNTAFQIVIDQAVRSRDSASAFAKVLDAQVESLQLAQDNIQANSFVYDGVVHVDNSTAYSAYQTAAKTYADAVAANTITTVGQSKIELQGKINQVVGKALAENAELSGSQGALNAQLRSIPTMIDDIKAIRKIMKDDLNAAISSDTMDDYTLSYYNSKTPKSEDSNLKNLQDYIEKYGDGDGQVRHADAVILAGKRWGDDIEAYEKQQIELESSEKLIINKILENNLKITSNNIVANNTLIYGTNSVASSKLLDKQLAANPSPDSPYIILTDSRTLAQAADDTGPQTPPVATAVGSSNNWQVAVDDAKSELRRKLALELYGDASQAYMIELTNVNQPVTQTTNAKGIVIYTARVTASTPVAVRGLTTDVTITTRGVGGAIRTETISFSQTNNTYLTPADAASQVYKNYSTGNLKILGIVANTSNKVIRRY